MDDKKKIDDFINMMDSFVANGGGHVNVTEAESDDDSMSVKTYKSADCGVGNMACCQPTAHIGIDDDYTPNK